MRIDGRDVSQLPVAAGDTAVKFTATLAAGTHALAPVFVTESGSEVGAYYCVVEGPVER